MAVASLFSSESPSESPSGVPSGGPKRSARLGLRPVGALVLLVALTAMAGCVTVRPEEREFLADSSMTFGSGGEADSHEEHVLSNREGSFGAGEFSGGGCGCN